MAEEYFSDTADRDNTNDFLPSNWETRRRDKLSSGQIAIVGFNSERLSGIQNV